MKEHMEWRYIQDPFPKLASYDQISLGDSEGNPLGGESLTRTLSGNGILNFEPFPTLNSPTLECWVFSYIV